VATVRRLLDLFCCAGGAARGYADAGFEVVGVDIDPQPNYPFEFVRGDALDFVKALTTSPRYEFQGEEFDAIHASPPCQRYAPGARRHGTQDSHPDLVGPTRELLAATGLPYIIENVVQAPLVDPIILCGTMFGLGVFRHRGFESNIPLRAPAHRKHKGRIGDGKYVTVAGHAGGSSTRDGWTNGSTADWARAMRIDWMTGREMAESIPPAYTKFLGLQLLRHLDGA
jgi:DNA (cytosine-5)-methyltransferase 1